MIGHHVFQHFSSRHCMFCLTLPCRTSPCYVWVLCILFLLLDDELWGQVESVNLCCYSAHQDWSLRITHNHIKSLEKKKSTTHYVYFSTIICRHWKSWILTVLLWLFNIYTHFSDTVRERIQRIPSIYTSWKRFGIQMQRPWIQVLAFSFLIEWPWAVLCCFNCKPD